MATWDRALAFGHWSLRLFEARWTTARSVRRDALDRCLAASRLAAPRGDAAESRILGDVEWVSDFWLRRVPVTRTSCMPRALTRFRMLRSAGIPVEFVLGIRPDATDVVGHAWIELRGAAIMEREPPAYQVTYRFGASQ